MNEDLKIVENYIISNRNQFYRIAYCFTQDKQSIFKIINRAILISFILIKRLKEIHHIKIWFYRIFFKVCKYSSKKTKLADDNFSKPIEKLSAKEKLIVIMKCFENLELDTICKILHKNKKYITSAYSKALDIISPDRNFTDQNLNSLRKDFYNIEIPEEFDFNIRRYMQETKKQMPKLEKLNMLFKFITIIVILALLSFVIFKFIIF